MQVHFIASTMLSEEFDELCEQLGYDPTPRNVWGIADGGTTAERLTEFAGRACYKSWQRPNPATAHVDGYMANIIDQGHFSIMEHASATFYVQGVSRALLAELSRHRHLSLSVESQRFVDYSQTRPVIPPAVAEVPGLAEEVIEPLYEKLTEEYAALVKTLTEGGLKRKQAREAARAVLPNCAPVDLVVTGNLRAWREVIAKRHHVAADAEISRFAAEILSWMKALAPSCFQDIPERPAGQDYDFAELTK
ncbi:FAD-dependent thymidylate synthase [Kitasatospora sp. NPDC056184]|uniref:FAD-dependent thymidylate synthase n=1 Tax=Kitasatospora sp. NPDC056184 TaxID=3345738 RepID=UPI0035D57E62